MIGGYLSLSMLDYPNHPSFVIFLNGCNLKCPYCHNNNIVSKQKVIKKEEIFELLKSRKKLINHVVITGGEATIYGDKLIELIKEIKDLGFFIKLDSNGLKPDILDKVISNNLVDFIAMDIKNTFKKYKTS